MMIAIRQALAVPLFLLGMAFMWAGVGCAWVSAQCGAAALWVIKP